MKRMTQNGEHLAQRIIAAFATMNSADPAHKEVFDLEGCTAFVSGIREGFDTLQAGRALLQMLATPAES